MGEEARTRGWAGLEPVTTELSLPDRQQVDGNCSVGAIVSGTRGKIPYSFESAFCCVSMVHSMS